MNTAERAGGRVVLADGGEAATAAPVHERRKAVVDASAASPVSLPVFDRLVASWTEHFSQKLDDVWRLRLTMALEPVRAVRLSGAAAELEPALIGLARLDGQGLPALIAFSRPAVYGLTDLALGGPGRPPGEAALKRAVTPIEAHLVQTVASHALATLDACLRPAGGLSLTFSHWAQETDRLADVREGDSALVLPVKLPLPSGDGVMTLVLPLALLAPIRPALAATFPGAAFGADGAWRAHLARQIGVSSVRLSAVLGETLQPLSVVQGLKVGETLAFDLPEDPLVSLRAGAVTVATGRLGRSNGRVAVRFESSAQTFGETVA